MSDLPSDGRSIVLKEKAEEKDAASSRPMPEYIYMYDWPAKRSLRSFQRQAATSRRLAGYRRSLPIMSDVSAIYSWRFIWRWSTGSLARSFQCDPVSVCRRTDRIDPSIRPPSLELWMYVRILRLIFRFIYLRKYLKFRAPTRDPVCVAHFFPPLSFLSSFCLSLSRSWPPSLFNLIVSVGAVAFTVVRATRTSR